MSEQQKKPQGMRPHGHGGPAMGRPVERAKDFKGTLKRLMVYLRPRRGQLITVLVMTIFSTAFSILSPKVMGRATNVLAEGVVKKMAGLPGAQIDFGKIGQILMFLIGLYLFSALFGYIQQLIMAGVAQKTVYEIREDVNQKLSRLPLKFYDSHTHGEILSRVTNDVDNISNTLQQSLTQLISAVVTIVGVLVMMLSISPLLTLVSIVVLPLSALVTMKIAKRSQRYFADQQRELGELNGHVEEMYTGHVIIKAFGREETSIKQFKEVNHRLYEAGWKAQFISGIIMPLLTFINNIGYVIVCVAGGVMATRKLLDVGDIQAFIQYSRQFTQPISQTANIVNILQSTVASAERVFELMDEEEEIPDAPRSVVPFEPKGAVQFKGVDFSYSATEPLIENMNIDVKPGQTVAIVGPTGAGKTTLVNLLMRFYEINGGAILIDGKNIQDLSRGELRNTFGMVLQDTWLFHGTIRDNIAYGRENATDEEIRAAAYAAQADRFIRTFPDGYDTMLNEEASNISQGQKQLITIARAILADPKILILDEATSSVDTRTEIYIQKAMQTLMKGRTSFVIAHRLSTIKGADLILVMNHGKIIEQGTHESLLQQKGFYADLYNSQFTGGNLEAV